MVAIVSKKKERRLLESKAPSVLLEGSLSAMGYFTLPSRQALMSWS